MVIRHNPRNVWLLCWCSWFFFVGVRYILFFHSIVWRSSSECFSSPDRCSVLQMRVEWCGRVLRTPFFWCWMVVRIFQLSLLFPNTFENGSSPLVLFCILKWICGWPLFKYFEKTLIASSPWGYIAKLPSTYWYRVVGFLKAELGDVFSIAPL